jgi:hypothetical protein
MFDENLVAHGQGLDVLVHEVAVAPKPINDVAYIQTILNHHTTPEEAGIVFSRTRPRLAGRGKPGVLSETAGDRICEQTNDYEQLRGTYASASPSICF